MSNQEEPTNKKFTSIHTWILDKGVGGEKFERMYLNAISTENLEMFQSEVSLSPPRRGLGERGGPWP